MKSIEEIGKRFDAEARVCEQMSGDVPFQRDLADLAAHMQRIEAKVSERNLWLANKSVSLGSEIVDNKKDDTAQRGDDTKPPYCPDCRVYHRPGQNTLCDDRTWHTDRREAAQRLRERLAAAEAALDDWEHSYPDDADRMKAHQEWRALAEGEETDHE